MLALETSMIIPSGDASDAEPQTQEPRSGEIAEPLENILRYISSGWDSLTRSLDDCKTFEDVKTDAKPILYFPADLPIPPAMRELQNRCSVQIAHLSTKIARLGPNNFDPNQTPGLLYLEHPYVVPGGQFNEMYGWDSYFILRGLLRENRIGLAKGMVEDFFFEIENYGGVLNANRTYYLTRSQPPFLSSMALAVYEAQTKQGHSDAHWLERAYGLVARDYEYWIQPPHLAGATGLSRYFDQGEGPVPEIMGDPSHYYRGVANYFLTHEGTESPHLIFLDGRNSSPNIVGPIFPTLACDPDSKAFEVSRCAPPDRVALSADFYEGDRSMRESGFDVSFRFGPFGAETHHYAPVCLNSLLYKTEKDLEKMAGILGRVDEARRWRIKALERKQRIVKYLWDDGRGLFFDYDFIAGKRSSYEYASTFYPLWAGLASREQARRVAKNLALFEQQGGIAMSRQNTQAQWDYPYGWAPIQLLAVEGLRRYAYRREGDRISYNFLTTVLRNFAHDGTIREKYDVTTESSDTHISAGYAQNVIGFGWTNGVFLELLNQLPPRLVSQLRQASNPPMTPRGVNSLAPGKDRSNASPALKREANR
jgi:alpha,alpha-trehalase